MSKLSDYDNAVKWNPWHGCKKVSAGCANCYVYEQDRRYNRDTTVVTKGATTYKLKAPIGSTVMLCFSSDFFIEDADIWRDECWDEIRYRNDCKFIIPTKRPERIMECVPDDWEDGWDNVLIIVSVENQEMADKRLQVLCNIPVKHRGIFCAPLIDKVSLLKWLDTGLIEEVSVSGDNAYSYKARPLMYEWVFQLYRECKYKDVAFWFHQTGTIFIRDGLNYGEARHRAMIEVANEFAEVLEVDYMEYKRKVAKADGYAKKMLVDSIWKSMLLNGMDMSLQVVKEVLEDGNFDNASDYEVQVLRSLKNAWQYILESIDLDITTKLVDTTVHMFDKLTDLSDYGYDSLVNDIVKLSVIPDIELCAAATFCYVVKSNMFFSINMYIAYLIANKILVQNGIGIMHLDEENIHTFGKKLDDYCQTDDAQDLFTYFKNNCILRV